MKTKKNYKRKRGKTRSNNTKRGGDSFFRKKKEAPKVSDWEGDFEEENIDKEYTNQKTFAKPMTEYNPFDEREKQKIIDAYSKVGLEHKKEIETDQQTIKDATKLLMDYKENPSCLEYDSYVQAGVNDSHLKNYKKVLDIKLNNLKKNPLMRLYKNDVEGLTKCTSFFRSPFRTTKSLIARNELMEEGKKQENEWRSQGGKRKSRRNKKRRTRTR